MAIRHSADVCFIGQSSYVSVPLASAEPGTMLARLYEDFLKAHERIYGHSSREPARIVNRRSVHGNDAGFEPGAGGVEKSRRVTGVGGALHLPQRSLGGLRHGEGAAAAGADLRLAAQGEPTAGQGDGKQGGERQEA